MYGRDLPKEEEAILREIIRSIDKKLDYSVRDGDKAEGPSFTVHISRKSMEATVALSIEELKAAKDDPSFRNRLRQKIKRHRDHMDDFHLLKDVLGTTAARMLRESARPEEAFFRQGFRRSARR